MHEKPSEDLCSDPRTEYAFDRLHRSEINCNSSDITTIVEIVKALTHRGIDPRVYFWRTVTGTEAGIIVESDGKPCPIEMKLTATPRPSMASSINAFHQYFGTKAIDGYVVHLGDDRLPLGGRVTTLPFAEL